MSPEINLFGHLAVHYKLVSRDQLAEATRKQEREGHVRPLGEVMVEMGLLQPQQMARLLEIQKQVLEKQAAKAASAPAPSASTAAAAEPPPRAPAAAVTDLAAPSGGSRLDRILAHAVALGASDLHVRSGEPLLLRTHGELAPSGDAPLVAADVEEIADELLAPEARDTLAREGQVDFAWTLAGRARFRGNAYRHQNGLGVVLRSIPLAAPSLGELGLPNELAQLTNHHQGLVLITGPAGCGKSSTLAALVRLINEERRDHVITVEDPIEYLHEPRRAVVNQRQVGRDTGSFARALKAALREDPDVIAIGELRDLETISLALTAAETGHLVLATLHTGSAIRTVDRVVGSFPPSQQPQIRTMLSESLRAVVSQRLLRRADGAGRVPALEVLLGTRAVANLIRESKTFQIRSILQTGAAQGMGLLDASLAQLVRAGTVGRDEALLHAEDPKTIPGGAA
jgi:twitching motility protein PilT